MNVFYLLSRRLARCDDGDATTPSIDQQQNELDEGYKPNS